MNYYLFNILFCLFTFGIYQTSFAHQVDHSSVTSVFKYDPVSGRCLRDGESGKEEGLNTWTGSFNQLSSGECADFNGRRIENTRHLSTKNFRGASFRDATLSNVQFLAETDFTGAQMQNAKFHEIWADEALFLDSNLDNSKWNLSSLSQARFLSGTSFKKAVFRATELSKALFQSVSLDEVDFRTAGMSDGVAIGVDSVRFEQIKSSLGAHFEDSWWTDCFVSEDSHLRGAYLGGADFSSCQIPSSKAFQGAIVNEFTFPWAFHQNIGDLEGQGFVFQSQFAEYQGYRYYPKQKDCRDSQGAPGRNLHYLGECGLFSGTQDHPLDITPILARSRKTLQDHFLPPQYLFDSRVFNGIQFKSVIYRGEDIRFRQSECHSCQFEDVHLQSKVSWNSQ